MLAPRGAFGKNPRKNFSPMDAIYKTSYKVRIADADPRAKLKMPALLQMLQEAATEHAHELGVDYTRLKPQNLGWVISKLIVEIEKIPSWGERVYITTWPSARERIATYREFSAKSAGGEPLFTARSQWLLIDTSTRRLARLERLGEWPMFPENANGGDFEEPFGKIDQSSPENILESRFAARNDDIDLNGHVNNAVFLIWAMESLPDSFAGREQKSVKISFLGEVLPHKEVRALCQYSSDYTVTSILSPETGREHARVCVEWRAQNS